MKVLDIKFDEANGYQKKISTTMFGRFDLYMYFVYMCDRCVESIYIQFVEFVATLQRSGLHNSKKDHDKKHHKRIYNQMNETKWDIRL